MTEVHVTGVDYTPRERAALGGVAGICRAINSERTFMCDLDANHEGDHHGFELPTITVTVPTTAPPTPKPHEDRDPAAGAARASEEGRADV